MYPWGLLIDIVTKLLGLQLFWMDSIDNCHVTCTHRHTKNICYEHVEKLVDGSFESSDVLLLDSTPRNGFQISLDPSSACSKSQVPQNRSKIIDFHQKSPIFNRQISTQYPFDINLVPNDRSQ